jgi:hypothetical protein
VHGTKKANSLLSPMGQNVGVYGIFKINVVKQKDINEPK